MAWKDILVFADGSEDGVARARMAAELALDLGARLEVCVLAIVPPETHSEGVPVMAEVFEEALKLARDDAGRVADALRAALPGFSERLVVETPEVELSDAARLAGALARGADLAVIGQPIEEDASHLDDALFEGALLRSGRPCLMVPRWPQPRAWGRRALLAWKGMREAARAAHDALPILTKAESVQMFMSGAGSELDGDGPFGLARIASHFARHGVTLSGEPKSGAGKKAAGAAILDEAKASGADLIVMGGYGHSRLREIVLGGATRTIARSSPIPVLFSH